MPPFLAHVDWTAAGVIATVLVGVGTIVVGGIALFLQLRALNRQVESATYQQMIDTFNDFSKEIIDHPDLQPAIYGKGAGYKAPSDPLDQHRVDWLIGMRFGWFESVILQRNRYQMSRKVTDHWCAILAKELEFPGMAAHWDRYQAYYHPDLREEIRQILAGQQEDGARP